MTVPVILMDCQKVWRLKLLYDYVQKHSDKFFKLLMCSVLMGMQALEPIQGILLKGWQIFQIGPDHLPKKETKC